MANVNSDKYILFLQQEALYKKMQESNIKEQINNEIEKEKAAFAEEGSDQQETRQKESSPLEESQDYMAMLAKASIQGLSEGKKTNNSNKNK